MDTHTSEEGAVKNARTIEKFLRCAEHSEKNSSESWGTGLTVERCPREFCSEHELSLLRFLTYEARNRVCELNITGQTKLWHDDAYIVFKPCNMHANEPFLVIS